MTDPGPALTPQDEKALQALIAWWADAGIEMDEPIVAPRAPATPVASNSAAPRLERRQAAPEPVRAATPQAARAAGYGDSAPKGPDAQTLAGGAETLDALMAAIETYDGCALKRTARNTIFARGDRAARVMIVGDAPGRDEDEQGEPFAGPTGQLVDRMLAAIGLGRDDAYLTCVLNWRPPGMRAPTQDEIALCLPFAERHIALKQPDFLILAGGQSTQTLLRSDAPITRLRGQWTDYQVRDKGGEPTGATIPTLPIFHPGYLIRRPSEKRLAWQDLLALSARLDGK